MGDKVALVNAPSQYARIIPGVDGSAPDRADVVIGFVADCGDLDLLDAVYDAALAGGRTWIGYPKPRQGHSDPPLRRDWLARAVRKFGVQSIAHASIDHAWSALLVEPIAVDAAENSLADAELAWPGA
ncbi:MAG: hypothetical protein PHQ28_01090 [Mycobacterium sp.]|nr:hypothetical protein [Mycobacterium sp.]